MALLFCSSWEITPFKSSSKINIFVSCSEICLSIVSLKHLVRIVVLLSWDSATNISISDSHRELFFSHMTNFLLHEFYFFLHCLFSAFDISRHAFYLCSQNRRLLAFLPYSFHLEFYFGLGWRNLHLQLFSCFLQLRFYFIFY